MNFSKKGLKLASVLAGTMLLGGVLAGCGDDANSNEIKVGSNFEITGNQANYGSAGLDGLVACGNIGHLAVFVYLANPVDRLADDAHVGHVLGLAPLDAQINGLALSIVGQLVQDDALPVADALLDP